jgi:hypothetical protein
MIEIAVYWIAASYVLGIGLAVDQLRRPLSEWEAAGRNRRFWVSMTIVMGFHALGQYAAAAYFISVVPRFRPAKRAGPRRTLQRLSAAIIRRWQRATRDDPAARRLTATEELATAAALLVFASSFIHSLVTADHFEEYWLFGVLFAAATCLQALWTALIFGDPSNRRILLTGAVGNAALVAVWAISRTVGLPLGPHPWQPEPAGVVDVLSTLDELGAVVLVAVILATLRGDRPSVSPAYLRLATTLVGPLFLFSVLAAFGGGHHHH